MTISVDVAKTKVPSPLAETSPDDHLQMRVATCSKETIGSGDMLL